MKIKIILITLLTILLVITGCNKEENENTLETNGMLSYTIDGEVALEKPTKEEGYIVNKIVCDNDSDMMWDNDNWEVELTNIKSNDRCTVDFTKDVNTPGYRVTVTSNVPQNLDSSSKTTVNNGTVIIYSTSPIQNVTGCKARIEDNKVIVENMTSNQTCNIVLEDKTLAGIIKAAYPSSGTRSSFISIYTEAALHEAKDYNASGSFSGTSYYFTGNPNNWVSFAGSLWRIIRINGNGSVRLLYAGSGGEDGYIESAQTYSVNGEYNHPQYVGWQYTKGDSLSTNRENATKSNAYAAVETWYNSNIASSYSNYIDTNAIYCNDRGENGAYSTSNQFYYAAYTRLITNKRPTYECRNEADRFYNFGLMTADEVSYAGGLYDVNNESAYYYLNTEGGSSTGIRYWWTMSPSYFHSTISTLIFIVHIGNPGRLVDTSVSTKGVVRPVVSLVSNVLVTGGDGSGNNPYTIALPN